MSQDAHGAVVVGVDGSVAAARAALWAAAEAARIGGPLRVVHCLRPAVPELAGLALPAGIAGGLHFRAAATRLLRAAADQCRALEPGVDVRCELVTGQPVEMLARLAEGAAAFVLGASGQSAVADVLIGAGAAELARRVTIPFVVVRDLAEIHHRGRVVVGVDGSPVTAHVVGFAAAQAAAHGRELVAVHAWSDIPLEALTAAGSTEIDRARAREDAAALLESCLAAARERHPELVIRRVVCLDRPVRALLEAGEGAALLVVGRHGRAGGTEGPLGSVGHAVLHYARCPVALVTGG